MPGSQPSIKILRCSFGSFERLPKTGSTPFTGEFIDQVSGAQEKRPQLDTNYMKTGYTKNLTAPNVNLTLDPSPYSEYNSCIVIAKARGADMGSGKMFTTAPSPESLGIPSRAILNFLQRIDSERICTHGFLLVRRNRIAAEGYWAPWSADHKHRMYSVSKSFVSLAIGMMVDEGRLTLDDRVAEYFPDKLPEKLHPWLAASTVRDLLTMSTAHSSTSYTRDDPDWVWTFFNRIPSHPPGTIFSYDTAATVVLTATVEQLAGMPFLDYMRPRFLDRIGFSADAWCIRTPEGVSWGGSGVICTLRDLARVALTCMNGGMWGEERVLPEEYVRTATSRQIDNTIRGNCGYGYQIWRDKENGFSFRGMGSQYAICFPDREFLFTCIANPSLSDWFGSNTLPHSYSHRRQNPERFAETDLCSG